MNDLNPLGLGSMDEHADKLFNFAELKIWLSKTTCMIYMREVFTLGNPHKTDRTTLCEIGLTTCQEDVKMAITHVAGYPGAHIGSDC